MNALRTFAQNTLRAVESDEESDDEVPPSPSDATARAASTKEIAIEQAQPAVASSTPARQTAADKFAALYASPAKSEPKSVDRFAALWRRPDESQRQETPRPPIVARGAPSSGPGKDSANTGRAGAEHGGRDCRDVSAAKPMMSKVRMPSDSDRSVVEVASLPVIQPVAVVHDNRKVDAVELKTDAVQARQRFEALLEIPGFKQMIGDMPVAEQGRGCQPSDEDSSPTGPILGFAEPSVLQIAVLAALLPQLAPKILAVTGPEEKQELLGCFSERYDALRAGYHDLQERWSEPNDTQEIETWKAAHQQALARVEEYSHQNAELKERLQYRRATGMDPLEKQELERKLAQRDAELAAASSAMLQLRDAIDDSSGAVTQRCAKLEQDLLVMQRKAESAEKELAAALLSLKAAQEASASAETRAVAAEQRSKQIQADAADNVDALDALLEEKGKYMEEREHYVDRRLVASMIANYLDHLQSRRQSLADQVIQQILQVLGGTDIAGSSAGARAREESQAAARAKGPLLDSFAAWLDSEIAEEVSEAG